MCEIGKPIETIFVEPLELPCAMPNQPQEQPQPEPVRIPVPVTVPTFA